MSLAMSMISLARRFRLLPRAVQGRWLSSTASGQSPSTASRVGALSQVGGAPWPSTWSRAPTAHSRTPTAHPQIPAPGAFLVMPPEAEAGPVGWAPGLTFSCPPLPPAHHLSTLCEKLTFHHGRMQCLGQGVTTITVASSIQEGAAEAIPGRTLCLEGAAAANSTTNALWGKASSSHLSA